MKAELVAWLLCAVLDLVRRVPSSGRAGAEVCPLVCLTSFYADLVDSSGPIRVQFCCDLPASAGTNVE